MSGRGNRPVVGTRHNPARARNGGRAKERRVDGGGGGGSGGDGGGVERVAEGRSGEIVWWG